MMDSVLTDVGFWASVSAVGTVVLTATVWMARKIARFSRRVGDFLDDYYGEPARVGVPARPGVMLRLQNDALDRKDIKAALALQTAETKLAIARLDARLTDVQRMAVDIHHETQPNDGSSMNDKLNNKLDQVNEALKSATD